MPTDPPKSTHVFGARLSQSAATSSPSTAFVHALSTVAELVSQGAITFDTGARRQNLLSIAHTLAAQPSSTTLSQGSLTTLVRIVSSEMQSLSQHPAGRDLLQATDRLVRHLVDLTGKRLQSGQATTQQKELAFQFFNTVRNFAISDASKQLTRRWLDTLGASQQPPRQPRQSLELDAVQPAQTDVSRKRNSPPAASDLVAASLQARPSKRPKKMPASRMTNHLKPVFDRDGGAAGHARRPAFLVATREDAQHLAPMGLAPELPGPSILASLSHPRNKQYLPLFGISESVKSARALNPALQARLGISKKLRIRQLGPAPGSKGESYLMTNSLMRGAYGKVRMAIGMDDGEVYAIKQIRTRYSRKKASHSSTGKLVPHATKDLDIRREAEIAKIVDSELAPSKQLLVEGDNYLLMPFVLGDGQAIASRLTLDVRQACCRVMIKDVVTMLADKMHANNILHGDMKPLNTLVQRGTGTTHISDFGSAQHFEADGYVPPGTPSGGTFTAPEKCTGEPWGVKSDVFEFGAGILNMLLGDPGRNIPNPFTYKRHPQGGVDYAAMQQTHADFNSWYQSRRNLFGLLDISKMIDSNHNKFDRIFKMAILADQDVTQYVASQMLVTDPVARASSADVKIFFERLADHDPRSFHDARQYLKDLPIDTDRFADMVSLKRAHDYFKQQDVPVF